MSFSAMGRKIKSKHHCKTKVKAFDPFARNTNNGAVQKNTDKVPSSMDQEVPFSLRQMFKNLDHRRQNKVFTAPDTSRVATPAKNSKEHKLLTRQFLQEASGKKSKNSANDSDDEQPVSSKKKKKTKNQQISGLDKKKTNVAEPSAGKIRRKLWKQQKQEEVMADLDEIAHFKDEVMFNERVDRPPTLKTKPRLAHDSLRAGRRFLASLGESEAQKRPLTPVKPAASNSRKDLAKAEELSELRERAVNMYRSMKQREAHNQREAAAAQVTRTPSRAPAYNLMTPVEI